MRPRCCAYSTSDENKRGVTLILEQIHTPEDVKALSGEQTKHLCDELHSFLLHSVAKTGGHLASNLGAVELTVAIHRVFDTSRDRLVFDVGHQCYAHKALTGRTAQFPTLRQYNGLSGFPKPNESVHDAFIAGHASNSVSVALGMARARSLLGEDYAVLALIGDGALSGGLAYEGLNNAGASGEPMIVVLNDNGMSISRNVGAISAHLSKLRNKPGYYAFKKAYRRVLRATKAGRALYTLNHSIKNSVKDAVLPSASLFEDMGFTYLGPVDGHDEAQLEETLRWARELNCPVLLHVRTVKGKGYPPAEREPNRWHGVGPFDVDSGVCKGSGENFASVFGAELCRLAGEDRRVCAITAAMCDGTGLADFAERFPKRFFDVGIAESQAAAMAAGMAKQGLVPVFAVYSTFLQRAYDQLIHDTALLNLHTVFAVDRAGLVGADGETHHGIFDATFLSDIPNMTVLCPASFAELRSMLRRAVLEMDGPVAIRYPRGGEERYHEDRSEGVFAELRAGNDVTLCAYGTMISPVLDAAELLAAQGVSARVVKVNCISPFLDRDVRRTFAGTKKLVVAEECASVGCVGQRLAAILTEEGTPLERLHLCNLGKQFPPHGSTKQLRAAFHIDAASIAETALEVVRA
ncbi:MAG: 1-deoxy-D-xylulose-5-phosphate synthase [Oscillospiraceae bacterium]|nr:1-deoxy-D-xylulose-5-phosphate synthase [Oscillospiraceae bacterium]